MLVAELGVGVNHRRQHDGEFGSVALTCGDGDPVGDTQARGIERSARVGEEGCARSRIGERRRDGTEQIPGIHGGLRSVDATAHDGSGRDPASATATEGADPGYGCSMEPTDPVDDELDAEELDLVAGGAQPSEQEPFSPGTYTIS